MPLDLFRATPEVFLRRSGGRETFRWESTIVKRMPGRGGRREHDNLVSLRAGGLPVPRPIAWAQEGWLRSLVVMEDVEHEETLRDRLGRVGPEERDVWAEQVLMIVFRLHELGWHHRDLYLQHFLLGNSLVLIDVGRARRRRFASRRWHVKDLAALRHSCPPNVGAREQLRFLSRYLNLRLVLDRKERSAWARAVAAKAARMARHVPRDERPL